MITVTKQVYTLRFYGVNETIIIRKLHKVHIKFQRFFLMYKHEYQNCSDRNNISKQYF